MFNIYIEHNETHELHMNVLKWVCGIFYFNNDILLVLLSVEFIEKEKKTKRRHLNFKTMNATAHSRCDNRQQNKRQTFHFQIGRTQWLNSIPIIDIISSSFVNKKKEFNSKQQQKAEETHYELYTKCLVWYGMELFIIIHNVQSFISLAFYHFTHFTTTRAAPGKRWMNSLSFHSLHRMAEVCETQTQYIII